MASSSSWGCIGLNVSHRTRPERSKDHPRIIVNFQHDEGRPGQHLRQPPHALGAVNSRQIKIDQDLSDRNRDMTSAGLDLVRREHGLEMMLDRVEEIDRRHLS